MIDPTTPRQPNTIPRTVGGIHVKRETTRSRPGARHSHAPSLVPAAPESGDQVEESRETGDADQGGRGDEQQWDHPGESVIIRISIAAAKVPLGERAVQGAYGGASRRPASRLSAERAVNPRGRFESVKT